MLLAPSSLKKLKFASYQSLALLACCSLEQAAVALASGPEPKGVGGVHIHRGPDGHLSLHTKFEPSRTILAIPMYLHRQLLHLPAALNPKELVGDMSIVVLMATFP